MSARESLLRLDHILSRYGYCSRAEARAWLAAGRVWVGEHVAKGPSEKAHPRNVHIDNQPIEFPDGILAMLHKPAGYVCSHESAEGTTVYTLFPERWSKRNPPIATIGRLDKNTTGLLLVTDLGDLVHRWTSPRNKVSKVYEVEVDAALPSGIVDRFASGELMLEGEGKPCLPALLEITSARSARIELTEGRFHQVKRMFASQGCNVLRLHRSRFGEYTLGDLPVGDWRALPTPII